MPWPAKLFFPTNLCPELRSALLYTGTSAKPPGRLCHTVSLSPPHICDGRKPLRIIRTPTFVTFVRPGLTQQRPNVLPGGILSTKNIAGSSGTNLLIGPAGAALCGCPQTTFVAPAGASAVGPQDSILSALRLSGAPLDFQFINGDLARDMGHTSAYYRFDMSFIKSFRIVPSHEQMRLEFKADIFNILNRVNFLNYNGADVLNILPLGISSTGKALKSCSLCQNAFSGEYIGSNGQPLTVQDLQHGRVSPDIVNPIFGGIGDPTSTDLARTLQVSVRFRW